MYCAWKDKAVAKIREKQSQARAEAPSQKLGTVASSIASAVAEAVAQESPQGAHASLKTAPPAASMFFQGLPSMSCAGGRARDLQLPAR